MTKLEVHLGPNLGPSLSPGLSQGLGLCLGQTLHFDLGRLGQHAEMCTSLSLLRSPLPG